jgi:hypothetical protein
MKPLAFAYWELNRLFTTTSFGDGYSEWKALAVVGCTQIAAIMLVISAISMVLGYRIFPPSKEFRLFFSAGLGVPVLAVNHFALRSGNRYAALEREFRTYARRTRTLGAVAVVLVVLMVFLAMIVMTSFASHLPYYQSRAPRYRPPP